MLSKIGLQRYGFRICKARHGEKIISDCGIVGSGGGGSTRSKRVLGNPDLSGRVLHAGLHAVRLTACLRHSGQVSADREA